jgi:hypothetical protein
LIQDGGSVVTYAPVGGQPPVLPLNALFYGLAAHLFRPRLDPRHPRDKLEQARQSVMAMR